MPRNGLTFPVRVRRKKYLVDLFRLFLNLRQHLRFSLDRDILRSEIVFQVNAKLACGEILDMANRSHDGIPPPKILADRACFRWRFDNYECLGHEDSGSLRGFPLIRIK